MPRIVVPLDGSKVAEKALCRLWQLKPLGPQEVILVAVAEEIDEQFPGLEEFSERQQVLLSAYLHDVAKKLELQTDVKTQLRSGRPDVEIQHAASAANADFILLTTHGRSGIKRWSIGSVADKVIRHADRPTLVVGPRAAEHEALREVKRILVPLDGSSVAEGALEVAASWAEKLGAELHLARVVSLAPFFVSDPVTGYYPAELVTAVEEAAVHYLQGLSARPQLCSARSAVLRGDAAAELISYEEANAIDLAIMTSRGRGGAARTLLGSTADRLLHGPAPVLIIPAH